MIVDRSFDLLAQDVTKVVAELCDRMAIFGKARQRLG